MSVTINVTRLDILGIIRTCQQNTNKLSFPFNRINFLRMVLHSDFFNHWFGSLKPLLISLFFWAKCIECLIFSLGFRSARQHDYIFYFVFVCFFLVGVRISKPLDLGCENIALLRIIFVNILKIFGLIGTRSIFGFLCLESWYFRIGGIKWSTILSIPWAPHIFRICTRPRHRLLILIKFEYRFFLCFSYYERHLLLSG